MICNYRASIFLGITLITCLIACKSEGDKASDATSTAKQEQATTSLESIPGEAMRDLWENCTAIDVIFYQTNFSISQDEQAAIRNTLGYFLPSPITHNPNCKPIGRLTFIADGEIRQEADIYNTQGCQYFIWIKDNKPAYINPMAPQGVTFLEQVMQQAKDRQQ